MFDIAIEGLPELEAHLERMTASMEEAPRRIAGLAGDAVLKSMQDEAPRRSGALAEGLRTEVRASGLEAEATFTTDQDYGPFVVHGTAAHDIMAGRGGARALHFGDVFVRSVHHPGTRPDPFDVRGLDRAALAVDEILDEAGDAIVGGKTL